MTYFLRTSRLGLRRWSAGDVPLARGLWTDPAVMRYVALGPMSDADVAQRVEREIASDAAHGLCYWPVFQLADDDFVGCCGLRPWQPGVPELGFHLVQAHWGKGYAPEVARGVIAHAFDGLGCDALYAGHHPDNDASRAVLTKLGFVYTHDAVYPPTGELEPCYRLERPR